MDILTRAATSVDGGLVAVASSPTKKGAVIYYGYVQRDGVVDDQPSGSGR